MHEIGEHPPDRELLLAFGVEPFLQFEGRGEHQRERHHTDDDCDQPVVHADLFTDQHGRQRRCDADADVGGDALVGLDGVALIYALAHRRQNAEDRYVAQRIGGVPEHIGDSEPAQFHRLRAAGGNDKGQNRGDRDQHRGHADPRQVLFPAPEFDRVEDHAEQRVVHGVPDLDREHHRGGFDRIDAQKQQIGRQTHVEQRVDHVLSGKVGIIAQPLARFGGPALARGEDLFHFGNNLHTHIPSRFRVGNACVFFYGRRKPAAR